ncbi:uncharacterized protein LOC119589564 [Penaeus monodon]|uniref:uncharacterized protein LOC119589564 n=1 Tax=Penaeus monodon TaxID=6687 RepID=UPI0018A7118C|nr:uncharacterized protein LOC119589564 [Penaeus monodon]
MTPNQSSHIRDTFYIEIQNSLLEDTAGPMREKLIVRPRIITKKSNQHKITQDYVDGGRDFDIFSLSQGFTLDVIGRCALAMRIDCQRNQQDPLLQLIRRFFKFAISPLVIMAMVAPALAPWLRCFRGTTTSALVEARVISNLNEVICRRRNTPGRQTLTRAHVCICALSLCTHVPLPSDFLQLLIDASDEGADDSFRLEMLDPSSHPPAQESSSAPLGTTSSSSSLLQPSRSSPPPEDDHNCMVDTCCRLTKARTRSLPGERTSEGGAGDVRSLDGGGGGGGDTSRGSERDSRVSDDATTGDDTTGVVSSEDRPSRSRSQERPPGGSSTNDEEPPSRTPHQERPPSSNSNNSNEEPPSRPHSHERPLHTNDNNENPPSRTPAQERPHLTDDEVVANAYMFVLAGYETTANAIAFTSYTLARYPQWQESCRVEELRSDGRAVIHRALLPHTSTHLPSVTWLRSPFLPQEQRVLTYEQVSCLHVLERVFQETLRIYPPVPSFVTREAGLTREVDGVTIPSGVNVTVPVWHIHHDPALWPDPEKFDPDRFLPEMKKGRPSLAWMPFGAGPRNCIGIRFARLEAKLALATLLRDYVIELAPLRQGPFARRCTNCDAVSYRRSMAEGEKNERRRVR